ncbi:MAG: SsrA-binding protein SmpB [Thiomargarita sp.]|nr:SsrA-binding protein SmpB [Thiomargarita sp.]
MKKKAKTPNNNIGVNKKARFDYFLQEKIEAGVVLEGWEVKSLRAGRLQLRDTYVIIKNNEVWILGMIITPLEAASSHISPESQRTRKLLLNRSEISKLIGILERKGYSLIPNRLYWKNRRVKVEIAVAKGKKEFDKRDTEKNRDWQREKGQILKHSNRE